MATEQFIKTGPAGPGAFAYEAAGLAWLAAAGPAPVAPVVTVLSQGEDRLVLERLDGPRPDRTAAYQFGQRLARTHDAGAASFGARPAGWTGPMYIGQASLPTGTAPSWGRFFAEQRIWPFAQLALQRGSLSVAQLRPIEQVTQRLVAGDFDDAAPPARIHGDLWAGNVIPGPLGLTLIDPAAHGGHRLTDLAMLDLFDQFCPPHLTDIYAGYTSVSRWLPDGWPALIGLHQLHPLLVHAVLFGAGYGDRAAAVARRY
ncbi:MAG: fructosamine kinase family protein [Propionibacteriaceae bacterium]|jgi:fructosamine-3-kinase|nr:fructosamine kinase family protein [Propionibacteriaceae bacterium]